MESSRRWTSRRSSATRSFLNSSSHGTWSELSPAASPFCCGGVTPSLHWSANRRLRSWNFCSQWRAVARRRVARDWTSMATVSQSLKPWRFTANASNNSSHVPHAWLWFWFFSLSGSASPLWFWWFSISYEKEEGKRKICCGLTINWLFPTPASSSHPSSNPIS